MISSKARNKHIFFLHSYSISAGITCQSNKARERNKRNTVRMEEVKLSLFADDMLLSFKDPKHSTRNSEILNT
jgi:hypothetical protein